MGIGFVALVWLCLIAVGEIILSPLTFFGYKNFRKSKSWAWLLLCIPAISLVALPGLALLIGTVSFIVGNHGPTTRPLEKDIIGVYELEPESREYLLKEKYRSVPESVLVLIESGSVLKSINLPDCLWGGFGNSGNKFISQEEHWALEDTNGFYSWFDGWSIGSFRIFGESPDYKLSATVGDPDSGNRLYFKKRQ